MDEKLAEYHFNEIKIGLKRNFQVTITESMLNDFAKLSGDFSPLHMDQEYAASTSFKKRVVHGMFLASFFSKLVGVHLPGKNALYFSQSLNFVNPCFVGDKITIEGEVTDKSIATKIITLKTTITNESGKRIIDGKAQVIVRDD